MERVSDDFSKSNCPIYRVHFSIHYTSKTKNLEMLKFQGFSVVERTRLEFTR